MICGGGSLRYYPDIVQPADPSQFLTGSWNFPNQNLLLTYRGEELLFGGSSYLHEISDAQIQLNEITVRSTFVPNSEAAFHLSLMFKQNLVPILGDEIQLIAIYENASDASHIYQV